MYGNIIKVLYVNTTTIGIKLTSFIRKNVNFEFENDSSVQYVFENLLYKLEDFQYELNNEEQAFINYCSDNNIQYLEL